MKQWVRTLKGAALIGGVMLVASPKRTVVVAASMAPPGLLTMIDHLVYATPDLQAGIDRIEALCGVRASLGGQHPGRGTRNALAALGPAVYLEIIGPDPEQPKPPDGRPFGIDNLAAPRLAAWAAKRTDLDAMVSRAAAQGIRLGQVVPGSRQRPDGVVLSWRFTDPRAVIEGGIVPFFIDWGQTPHPAATAARGLTLAEFRAEHPDPDRIRKILDGLAIDLPLQASPKPALVASVRSPRGLVELR